VKAIVERRLSISGETDMTLLPLDSSEILELVAGWLAEKENYQWLDFGNGRQLVTAALLKIMAQRETHFLRVYTSEKEDTPIGVLGLNSVDRTFKTATFWGISGNKSFRNRGYSTFASSKFLTFAFRDLGLHTINTWVVEHNPSLRTVERLHFRFIGRQRQCHFIDGRPYDRLLFDLLAGEHKEIENGRPHRVEKSYLETVRRDSERPGTGVRHDLFASSGAWREDQPG
jgi:RimJ/RimL family protein N-acetyltransferase